MKQFFFCTFLFLIPFLSVGQANYRKGLVVTTQGDTLQGFIDYKEWLKNPKNISFKKSLDQKEEQAFTPVTSNYFAIENLESYLSYQGRVSADRTGLSEITSHIDTSKVFTQAFLKVLQRGENISLLMLSDDIKVRFFLKDNKDNTIQELTYRRYYDVKTNNTLVNSKGFMGQFWVAATKYNAATPLLKKQLEKTDYESQDLIKIALLINNEKAEKQDSKSDKSIRLFAGIGLNSAKTEVEGEHMFASANTVSIGSTLPKLVIGFDKFVNPNVGRLIFRSELSFTKTSQKLSRQINTTLFQEEFKQNIFALSPQIIYNIYNQEKVKILIGAGMALNLVGYPETEKHYENLENFWIIVPIRAGVRFHKLELSAIYFPPTTITKFADFAFVTNTAQLQLTYYINK